MIRFSVITIVRNDPVGVIRTLQSVFSQSYKNFEVIVQDGASTDETSDVLRGFGDWIDSLVIEKDGGIYDAMNRALRRATGDYLIFMNAADLFVDGHVLEKVATMIDPENDDIFAGQALSDETGKVHTYRPPHLFWLGSTIDHQAAFIRTTLMKQLEYDQSYKIAGDLHFFTRARQGGANIRHERIFVARKPFSVGVSSDFTDRVNDRLSMLEEAWGDKHPVRQTITKEVAADLRKTFAISEDYFPEQPIQDMLRLRGEWMRLLDAGKSL